MGMLGWLVVIGAQGFFAIACCRHAGSVLGLAFYTFVMCVLSLVAGVLLKTAPASKITRKNRMAGLLLPWAFTYAGGQLSRLLLWNICVSALYGIAIALCDSIFVVGLQSGDGASVINNRSMGQLVLFWSTAACWGLITCVWVRMMQLYVQERRSRTSAQADRRKLVILLLAPVLILTSAAMVYNGWLWLGFLVTATPLFLYLIPIMLMMVVIVLSLLRGKPIRWN